MSLYMPGNKSSSSRADTQYDNRTLPNGSKTILASRGKPQGIISDNAGQFKLASETVSEFWRQILTHDDVISYTANEKINWKFIVKLAPWMGGFYERLIGLLKRSLRKTIGKLCLSNEQLLTVLKERAAEFKAFSLHWR